MKLGYKSVARCPNCGAGMVLSAGADKGNMDTVTGEHLVIHYTSCPECGTRCRTTTSSVVVKRGDKKPPEQPALFALV